MKKYQILILSLIITLVVSVLGLFIFPIFFIDNFQIRDTIPIIALVGPYIIFGYSYWAQNIASKRRLKKNVQWFFSNFQTFTSTPLDTPIPEPKFLSITHFFIIYEKEFGRYLDFRIISTKHSQLQEIFLLNERFWIKYSMQEGLSIQYSDDNCKTYQKIENRKKMYNEIIRFCKTRFGIVLECLQ
ncbi:MAG: hypothetical protein JW776_03270 [Candidatus Lokiarchaeota archaeon]|nr:hypothetical protein [Candidatus Lokiarchaeota archaeon]